MNKIISLAHGLRISGLTLAHQPIERPNVVFIYSDDQEAPSAQQQHTL